MFFLLFLSLEEWIKVLCYSINSFASEHPPPPKKKRKKKRQKHQKYPTLHISSNFGGIYVSTSSCKTEIDFSSKTQSNTSLGDPCWIHRDQSSFRLYHTPFPFTVLERVWGYDIYYKTGLAPVVGSTGEKVFSIC